MPKVIDSALTTHLGLETTSLTTLWRITRIDKKEFFFTDHDVDITFEGNLYEASLGYDRTAIANQVGLSVDNLDVSGFLDSSALTDGDLRAGLFDFAEVRISVVNFTDLSQGEMKMRRGKIGEVTYRDSGSFQAELRGLTQAYTQQIVELYEPDCRVDLGDSKCQVNLFPDVVLRVTDYEVGDLIRASELLAGITPITVLVPGDVDANDISGNEAVGTLGSQAVQQTVIAIVGAGALEFTPTASDSPSQSFVSYPDIPEYNIGASEFTIEAHVRLKDLTSPSGDPTLHVIASHYINSGNQRAWYVRIDTSANQLQLFLSDDGTSTAPALTIVGAFTWVVDTDYHIAVTRDSADDVRMFVDGVQVGSTTSVTFAIHNSTAVLQLGKISSIGFGEQPLDGFIDDFRFVVGEAVYTSGFTPPSAPHTAVYNDLFDGLGTPDFDDRIYTCTIAGQTAIAQPSYDVGLGNTTADGGCTFESGEAFTRAGIVSNVTDNRVFSITFPNGADTREVIDWFKYGAIIWETGNNAFAVGLNMEVKVNLPSVTTGGITMAVDDTDTFSRGSGSFIDDGFVVGMTINTTGFTDGANNGQFVITGVAALTIDIAETTLVAESGTGDEDITSEELFSLFLPMPFVVQAGDTFGVYAGCDKRLATCIEKFDNVINFRGEPYVPGQDAFIAVQTSR